MKEKDTSRPNIVLITLDDFSYDIFMQNIDMFPNMKWLKENSVFFENAFSVGPATIYSFPGIIGSVYPYYFGVGINKNVDTIDSVLKNAGYNTAFINECNGFLTPFFGYCKNIDYQNHFLDLSHSKVDRKFGDVFLMKNKSEKTRDPWQLEYRLRKIFLRIVSAQFIIKIARYLFNFFHFLRKNLTNKGQDFEHRTRLYNEFINDILSFISTRLGQPQYLWVHTIINHSPYFPLESTDKFSIKEIDRLNYRATSNFINSKTVKKLKTLYIESMKRTEKLITDILEEMESSGLKENTLVIITADHGEDFMEQGYFGHGVESSSDQLLHVPLIFYWPSRLEPRCIKTPVSTIDILPTICNLIDVPVPATARGISQEKLICGITEKTKDALKQDYRPLFSEAWDTDGLLDRTPGYKSNKTVFTVRKGKYKLRTILNKVDKNIVEAIDLQDWTSKEELDMEDCLMLVDDLRSELYKHLRDEHSFTEYLSTESEKIRLKGKIKKLKKI